MCACVSPPADEDVAFKIVSREWEMQKKVGARGCAGPYACRKPVTRAPPPPSMLWCVQHGFRASFDRGTLQLHFNFKRYRYRK